MQFEKTEHKQLVQEVIKSSSFPGAILELALDLKTTVDNAEIGEITSFDRSEHKQLVQEVIKTGNFPFENKSAIIILSFSLIASLPSPLPFSLLYI